MYKQKSLIKSNAFAGYSVPTEPVNIEFSYLRVIYIKIYL